MSEQSKAKVISAALAAHAALEALILELTQDGEPSPAPAPPAPPAATAPCNHEHREDFRTFGVTEHWRCKDCGFVFRR